VQNLPFHYFIALRGEFIREKMAERRAIAEARAKAGLDEDVIEFDAEEAKSGHLASRVNESLDRQSGVSSKAG